MHEICFRVLFINKLKIKTNKFRLRLKSIAILIYEIKQSTKTFLLTCYSINSFNNDIILMAYDTTYKH